MPASNKHQDFGERWWWAWRGWLVLTLVWLGACLWLGREPASWSQGWVGWWTGDRTGAGSIRSVKPYLTPGTEVATVAGKAAFRITGLGAISLGHWQEKRIPWTWAGWVRVKSASGAWPTNLLAVRSGTAPGSSFLLGFTGGRPTAELLTSTAGDTTDTRVNLELQAAEARPMGRWMHLAFSTDGSLLRLLVNGVPVAEKTWSGEHGPALHLATLRLRGDVRGEEILTSRANVMSVEQDEVVLYGRAVPPAELAELAARGRGAWAREVDRPAIARRIWRWGWPGALGGFVLLLGWKLRPRLRAWLVEAAQLLARPACRPVRWALVCGGLFTLVLTVALHRHARQSEEARFAEMLARLHGETDAYWENIAAFLMRARDWVAAQPELSQERWEAWLASNHFPHDHPGVIGVGYAEQMQPGDRAAHEARWSQRHGFDYRVQPGPDAPRQPVLELAENPGLPVVLYGARELKRSQWLTNHSILGRDLLHRPVNEAREWSESRRVEAAAARNEITSSALETIAPAGWYGAPVEGLRLYVPWTLRTKQDEADRVVPLDSSAWRGVLFASVDLREPLRSRYGEATPLIGCRIFEGGLSGDIHDLVADTGTFLPATADRPEARQRGRLEIPFYHHRLFVEAWSTRAFEAQSLRRWAWIAGGGSAALTALAAALLLVQVRARARQQQVLDALSAANTELRITQRERETMSRDLHDGSIQNLYALGLNLQRVQQLLGTAPDRAPGELQNSLEMLNQSIAELRRFILSSGVEAGTSSTVPGALESLVERLRKSTAVEIHLRVDGRAVTLEPRVGVELLNLVREAVSNALRHAVAQRISIRLEPQPEPGPARWWILEVVDDGRGFDARKPNGHGRGLKNLAARAKELGGRSAFESIHGGGTRVTVVFPT